MPTIDRANHGPVEPDRPQRDDDAGNKARRTGFSPPAFVGALLGGLRRPAAARAAAPPQIGPGGVKAVCWPPLQPPSRNPVVVGIYPHFDDESNGSRGFLKLILRGIRVHTVHATSGEGGQNVSRDSRSGALVQQLPADPAALARERHRESRHFLRRLGVGPRSMMTTLHGNRDVDPFVEGARQDTAFLIDPEQGIWRVAATKQQLIDTLAQHRPVAIVTMTHDGAVHQAHRAVHELVEQTVAEFAAHYGVDSPGVFGARETGWAPDNELEPLDPQRTVHVELDRGEQRAKVKALVRSFHGQPPGNPYRSDAVPRDPLHRHDVYLDSAGRLADDRRRAQSDDPAVEGNARGWDFLRPDEYFVAGAATSSAQIDAFRALFERRVRPTRVAWQTLSSHLPMPGPKTQAVRLTPLDDETTDES